MKQFTVELSPAEIEFLCEGLQCYMEADCNGISGLPSFEAPAFWREWAPQYIGFAMGPCYRMTRREAEKTKRSNNRRAELIEKLAALKPRTPCKAA